MLKLRWSNKAMTSCALLCVLRRHVEGLLLQQGDRLSKMGRHKPAMI